MKKPQVLLFDVNETLLDLSSMKTEINDSLGHEFAFNQWFAMLLHYSNTGPVLGVRLSQKLPPSLNKNWAAGFG